LLDGAGVDEPGQAGAGADAQLVVDVTQVDLDGLVAEEQPGGHLLVAEAVGDLQRDPQFLGGEPDVDGLAATDRADARDGQLGGRAPRPRLGAELLEGQVGPLELTDRLAA
jgi:hypothetical protein